MRSVHLSRTLNACAAATLMAAGGGISAQTPAAPPSGAAKPAAQTPPAAQSPEKPTQGGVIRRTFDMITTDVIVRDNQGQFIADLKKDEFDIMEDGVKQEVVSFVLGEDRIHIRNLRRNPKATVLIDEDWRPRTKRYASGAAAVAIRGDVTILDLESSKEPLNEIFVAHAEKFLDGAKGDTDYWDTEDGERYHVCYLAPAIVVNWDFRKFGTS